MYERELLKLQLPRIASVQDGASQATCRRQAGQVLRKSKSGEWVVSSILVRICGMIWRVNEPAGEPRLGLWQSAWEGKNHRRARRSEFSASTEGVAKQKEQAIVPALLCLPSAMLPTPTASAIAASAVALLISLLIALTIKAFVLILVAID